MGFFYLQHREFASCYLSLSPKSLWKRTFLLETRIPSRRLQGAHSRMGRVAQPMHTCYKHSPSLLTVARYQGVCVRSAPWPSHRTQQLQNGTNRLESLALFTHSMCRMFWDQVCPHWWAKWWALKDAQGNHSSAEILLGRNGFLVPHCVMNNSHKGDLLLL